LSLCITQVTNKDIQGRHGREEAGKVWSLPRFLIRNNWSNNFGVEYWTLPGSNLPKKLKNKNFVGPKKSV
jgi:hypothetical protein